MHLKGKKGGSLSIGIQVEGRNLSFMEVRTPNPPNPALATLKRSGLLVGEKIRSVPVPFLIQERMASSEREKERRKEKVQTSINRSSEICSSTVASEMPVP